MKIDKTASQIENWKRLRWSGLPSALSSGISNRELKDVLNSTASIIIIYDGISNRELKEKETGQEEEERRHSCISNRELKGLWFCVRFFLWFLCISNRELKDRLSRLRRSDAYASASQIENWKLRSFFAIVAKPFQRRISNRELKDHFSTKALRFLRHLRISNRELKAVTSFPTFINTSAQNASQIENWKSAEKLYNPSADGIM